MNSTRDTAAWASSARSLPGSGSGAAANRTLRGCLFQRGARVCRMVLLTLSANLMLPAATVLADGDPEVGAEKAHTCLGCHGVKHYINTYPTYHVPRIAGQNREYLVLALQSYRDQTRSHPTMQANAGLLSDQDIEDIAAWLAAQGGN